MKRGSGILYPVSSLPSRFGIGGFTKEAYEFVDFLEKAGQMYWQVLPLGPTGFGDSPYATLSTFAGNPYFISLDDLIAEGLLTEEECWSKFWGNDPEHVDYGAVYEGRTEILEKAHARFRETADTNEEYQKFLKDEQYWLEDYCLFMALKKEHQNAPWSEWETEYRNRDRKAMSVVGEVLENTVDFYRFQQYEFIKQWDKLHAYANEHGVKIIGDIPFYVAFDSADTWSHPEMFEFDEKNIPTKVAGCPPDAFSETGQLWGNPIYNWDYLKRKNYEWWIHRFERCFRFYDVLRIDHFRGFDAYYTIPYGDETAEDGKWEKGPGMDLFRAVKKQLGDVEIIAEDLGLITKSVRKLLAESGFPGMQVLQFAFDSSERSTYLPYNHTRNSVVYTGTHDNMTTRGWIESISDHDRDFARRYINSIYTDYGKFTWDFIREAFRSVADTCIIPITDYLVKGNEARLNTPAVGAGNWTWRCTTPLSEDLAKSIRELAQLYGRIPLPEEEEEEAEEEEAEKDRAVKDSEARDDGTASSGKENLVARAKAGDEIREEEIVGTAARDAAQNAARIEGGYSVSDALEKAEQEKAEIEEAEKIDEAKG